jgi:hypothetical protein
LAQAPLVIVFSHVTNPPSPQATAPPRHAPPSGWFGLRECSCGPVLRPSHGSLRAAAPAALQCPLQGLLLGLGPGGSCSPCPRPTAAVSPPPVHGDDVPSTQCTTVPLRWQSACSLAVMRVGWMRNSLAARACTALLVGWTHALLVIWVPTQPPRASQAAQLAPEGRMAPPRACRPHLARGCVGQGSTV